MACEMKMRPSTPGEILEELYLEPAGVSKTAFAEAAGVTRKHISRIVSGHAAVTADMAERIATVLGGTAEYWLNLQNAVDLYAARQRLPKAVKQPHRVPAFAEMHAAD